MQPSDEEPGLLYHEFILLLGRMALTCIKSSKTEEGKLRIFLTENLGLKVPEKGDAGVISSEEYDLDAPFSDEDTLIDSEEGKYGESERELLLEEVMEKYLEEMEYEGVLKELNSLPLPPPELNIEQFNVPGTATFTSKRMYIGRRLPKADEGKKKEPPKKAAPKRAAPRRGEAPPKQWKIAEAPPNPREGGYIDRFRELMRGCTAPVFPTYSKWAHVNSKVGPCIIKEILFPPTPPPQAHEVGTLIESANVYHATASYEMSILTFESALHAWRGLGVPMRSEVLLYFEMAIGQCLESAGLTEAALQIYIKAKNMNKNMPHNHPDKALPYLGLGSVLFRMEEYGWALRAYLYARETREQYVGGDTVQAATVYNNLGCCMSHLNRYYIYYIYYIYTIYIL